MLFLITKVNSEIELTQFVKAYKASMMLLKPEITYFLS